jgi:hypothetical protein
VSFQLEPLPYAQWEPTKTTLHLYTQIVGKIALRASPLRNHWWNLTFRPSSRGLVTTRLRSADVFFDIAFDLVDHCVVVRTERAHAPLTLALHDGLSVGAFYTELMRGLEALGIDVPILAKPYGVPITTPFALDEEHHTYDRIAVRRWYEAVLWSSEVLERFASEFAGKQGPVQLFWHSFDLALGRYSGRRSAAPPSANPVEREAYSHEVIAFGFWPGDPSSPEAAYYTYTAPEPSGLEQQSLLPSGARWVSRGASHLGVVPYETIRTAADPAAALTAFLQTGYRAGARTAHWDMDALAHG